MKQLNWILFTITALGFAQGATAVQPLEMDNAIVIEAEDTLAVDQLVVTGRNFDNGQTIQLTPGGHSATGTGTNGDRDPYRDTGRRV